MTSGGYSDIGVWLAGQCLAAVQSSIEAAGLDAIGQVELVHGTGVPLQDVCDDGILWARVANPYPSNGDGQPFAGQRADMEWPAWGVPVEIGVLNCRTNIDDDGYAPSVEDETGYAVRDGNYRMAVLDACRGYLPDLVRPCAQSFALSPWTPIGPDGGISGGIVVVTFVTTAIAVTADTAGPAQ